MSDHTDDYLLAACIVPQTVRYSGLQVVSQKMLSVNFGALVC